jgi:predicted Zn-dependent protease
MIKTLKKVGNSVLNIALGVSGSILIVLAGTYVYMEMFSQYAQERYIHKMYDELWVKTGQTQEKIPLEIVDSPIINAYNDGNKIVIYTGLINSTKSWDEVALVLGHEIAHGNLWHLRMLNAWPVAQTDAEVSVLEANADKMGAVYMMKAGYDVCKGREWFKTMLDSQGDYQGGNHPGYAYRYNELNINCD